MNWGILCSHDHRNAGITYSDVFHDGCSALLQYYNRDTQATPSIIMYGRAIIGQRGGVHLLDHHAAHHDSCAMRNASYLASRAYNECTARPVVYTSAYNDSSYQALASSYTVAVYSKCNRFFSASHDVEQVVRFACRPSHHLLCRSLLETDLVQSLVCHNEWLRIVLPDQQAIVGPA
jgi:hypothetical protein